MIPKLTNLLNSRVFWRNMAIALAASVAAVAAQLAFGRLTVFAITPVLVGLAAVIFSADWAGPVAGWISAAVVAVWSVVYLRFVFHYPPVDVAVRIGIFGAEAALVTLGSARLYRSRRELERSNMRQRQLVETASEGILVVNTAGVITYANARMHEILACGRGTLECRKFEQFVFPEDLAAERIRLQRRGPTAREQIDRRLRRADGVEIWVLSCSNPTYDERGEFSGVLSMMTDITERKSAETALRRSEEKFRSLFENVLEGVYQSTPDGRILAANPMLLEMLGLESEAEMNDVNISKDLYVDPKVRKQLLAILEREGRFRNVEYELRRRDGRVITVLENARVVRASDGEVLYYEGTLTDITERKRVEEQLRQAQKTEALAGIAAGIAQDFSSIMTVITGYCELLAQDRSLSVSARDHAIEALKAAETAGMLTRQLTALNGRVEAEQTAIDLSRIVRQMEQLLRESLGRDIELRMLLEDGATVLADAMQIEQIVVNLTTNSKEAMPSGGVVEISAALTHAGAAFCEKHPGANPGAYVALSVRDTGIGIPAHLLGKLIDPMFSMGKARVTGLGLSTVHAIAVRHGGFVSAESTPGLGATFSVYLPLAPQANAGADAALRGARPGETILIVEEEPLVRDLSRDMLERLGYRVVQAASVEEAERVASSGRRVDLLMTNVVVGAESGAELARRLARKKPGLKVLLVSGRADQTKCPDFTADAHLRKPFSDETLGRKLRQILDHS